MTKSVSRTAGFTAALVLILASVSMAQRPALPGGQSRAEVVTRLRSMMETTGMTSEQIRSRLRAQGYSESLLDPFMPGARGADTTLVPDDDVFAAVRSLGIGDSLSTDTLRSLSRRDRMRLLAQDSAFADSVLIALRQDTTEGTREALRLLLRTRPSERSLADSGFALFGQSLFERETSEFDPNISAAVGPDYALGPGDQLVLVLTGATEKAHRLEVTRQGFVVIPEVGQISVANLTLGQFEDQLYGLLRRVYSGVGRGADATTRFSINVARTGSNQIHVTGDVVRPGAYQVSRAGSVVTALYLAGGPTERGSMRRLQIRRAGDLVGTLDLYDYALQGVSTTFALRSGDVLFVPPHGPRVRMTGAVLRPATYELKPGETLADLIRMAGGFRPEADRRFVQIDRIIPSLERTSIGASRRMIDVGSDLLQTGFGPPEPLFAGDIVHVLSVAKRLSGRVFVLGNVWRPGPVAFAPGMRLSSALRRAGGLQPDAFMDELLISRLLPDSSRQMIRAAVMDTSGTAEPDVVLSDADEIRVFSRSEMRPQTYITISGAIRQPGRIPYREGITLRQAILLAGGLEQSALLTEAEIARIPANRTRGVMAETHRVPLDSTYLFGRLNDGKYVGAPGVPARASGAPEVELEPYDAILILQQPNWELPQVVTIRGEVRNPGTYTIRSHGERLADVINRAGGLTENGYAGGINFIRKRDHVGRIGLNLPAVLKNRRHSDNILLADGDSILIPRFEPVVRVRGEVNAPVAIPYVAGQNIDYYINAAGGGTGQADLDRAYVTQANGKVESRSSYLGLVSWVPKPQPGSVVVIPVRPDKRPFNWSAFFGQLATLLSAAVAVIAVTR